MKLQINQELSVETEIPFQTIFNFHLTWEVNDHARLYLTGILEPSAESDEVDYKKTIKILLNEETLFWGTLMEQQCSWSGITTATIVAVSPSIQLDVIKHSTAYQDTSQCYSEIAKKRTRESGGNMLCMVEKRCIEKPIICYHETAWEFIRRMASRQNTFIIPDIMTGEPNLWYGMKHGNLIKNDLTREKMTIEIEKSYKKSVRNCCRKLYHVECSYNYSLGDSVQLYGETCVVHKKQVYFRKGELKFFYVLSEQLRVHERYNEAFTGLSLKGTIKDVNAESIQIQFDIGGETGDYYYPWRPETGNALYEMPEKGAKVMVYFDSFDERDGVAVRCINQSEADYGESVKVNKTSDGANIHLSFDEIEVVKGDASFSIGDDSEIGFCGRKIQLEGIGKIKVLAKQIRLSASSEIKAVSEY